MVISDSDEKSNEISYLIEFILWACSFIKRLGLRMNHASLKTSRLSKSYWTNDFVKFHKFLTGF
jgi:hypothetical protein